MVAAAAKISARADTVRCIEWDEMPESVREIRDGFDVRREGVLMKHQAQWVALRKPIKVCRKGRRTGITFATALDKTIKAASSKKAGGGNTYYIPDKKEKGLEFIGYCAKMARLMAEAQSGGVSQVEEFLFADQDEAGNTRQITAWRIRFASGFQVNALSSRPSNIRGLQGDVVIDEAAFHPDVQAVLDAVTALLIWGGEITIISSHNGKKNPFNQLCRDIEENKYGEDAVVFTVTFDDAVKNGLYERVCAMKGERPTPEGKKKWYAMIRNGYGPRKAAMREELDCIPRDGGGICIPGIWIENAMKEERPVLRLALDDDFNERPEYDRQKWCEEWIERDLRPVLATMAPDHEHVAGMDYARHRHFSILTPMAITETLRRRVPFIVEMHNVPTRQQEQILWALIEAMPKRRGVAIDATGPGQTIAEYTADKFGADQVHQVDLSRAWYGLWMPKLIQAFEDDMMDLPRDSNTEADLRAIERIDGIPMVPKVAARDLKDADLFRHGDAAIALVLAYFASLNKSGPIEFQQVGRERATAGMDDYVGAGGRRDTFGYMT
jgi:phage FluMu gp28-like protein